jgi:hypothetical protein
VRRDLDDGVTLDTVRDLAAVSRGMAVSRMSS